MYSFVVVYLLSLCFYSAVSTCPSGSVYVSTQGNDTTGDGTINKPFQKLLTAYHKISTNLTGTICIEPGKYNDTSLVPWTGNCSVSLFPVDPSNPPIFDSIMIFSNITLNIENLVFGSNSSVCAFILDNGANLTITNITSPSTNVNISFHSANTVILNHLKLGSLEVNNLQDDVGLLDVQVFDLNIGGLWVNSRSVSLYACSFSGPVYLSAGITMTQQCWFSFINNDDDIFNIIYIDWNNARHSIQNNTFINNTLTGNSDDSVIGFQFSFALAYVNFYGNHFSCNMLALPNMNPTVARGLPSGVIDNNWVISSNTMDPSCPYECLPGYELALNGIAGCSMCLPGWVSLGRTSPCSPCPGGTYSDRNNCTACDPGTYSGQGSTVCLICKEGTSTVDNTGCIPCPTNFYSSLGICKKCTDSDYTERSCSDCGFFMSVESNCKQLSVNGMIVIGAVAGTVLIIIVVVIVFRCVRKREYSQLN